MEKIKIVNLVIIISLGLVVGSLFFIYHEYSSAKTSCEELGFEYEFHYPNHFCNNESYFQYNTGWDFSNEFNISELVLP